MPIRDARIVECAACERRFDLNFADRMQERQKLHAVEQLHMFGPCAFLRRIYEPRHSLVELYNTPWLEEGRLVYFHSEACEQSYCSSGSFDYIWCDGCDRQVCEQNPRNGWHLQFRHHAGMDTYLCLRCYQDEILENGQPREDFEGDRVKGGMFFSYGNAEPKDKGFEEVAGFENHFVSDRKAAQRYNNHALKLIDTKRKVITAYERLAIGGLEGYVTMMSKANERIRGSMKPFP